MVDIQITVTVPEIILESSLIRTMIVSKMQSKTGPDIRRLFEKTTRGWSNRPNFLQKFTSKVGYVSVMVWPSGSNKAGNIYALVNNGAGPHTITPRSRGLLRFQRGYRAATRPRILSSRSPSRYGETVSAHLVRHPGFEAREFDATIAEQYAGTFAADMQNVIHVAVVKSGGA